MKEFTITVELANRVLTYLGSRPYSETVELIQAINGEYQAQLPVPTEEPKKAPTKAK